MLCHAGCVTLPREWQTALGALSTNIRCGLSIPVRHQMSVQFQNQDLTYGTGHRLLLGRWSRCAQGWSQARDATAEQLEAVTSPGAPGNSYGHARTLHDSFQRVRVSLPNGYSPQAPRRSVRSVEWSIGWFPLPQGLDMPLCWTLVKQHRGKATRLSLVAKPPTNERVVRARTALARRRSGPGYGWLATPSASNHQPTHRQK
jgi:hypothetical protein